MLNRYQYLLHINKYSNHDKIMKLYNKRSLPLIYINQCPYHKLKICNVVKVQSSNLADRYRNYIMKKIQSALHL